MKNLGDTSLPEVYERRDEFGDFIIRETVKVIAIRQDGMMALIDGWLPGGGVDEGESHEEAVARELMEEIGARGNILRGIGYTTHYRTEIGKQYKIYGYVVAVEEIGTPTTQQADEMSWDISWHPPEDALGIMRKGIANFVISDPFSESSQRLSNGLGYELILGEHLNTKQAVV